jgi:hypothetical protein
VADNLQEEQNAQRELEWNLESAELAYTVISRYVEHAQLSGMVIALLAHGLGEEKLTSLVQSDYWQSYQASRHALGDARSEIEQLTRLIDRMREEMTGGEAGDGG